MSLRCAQIILASLSAATLAARFSRRDSSGDVQTFDFGSGADNFGHDNVGLGILNDDWTLFHHVGAGSLVSSNKRWFHCAEYKHLGKSVKEVREVLGITCLWTRGCVGYQVHEGSTSSKYLMGALLLDKTSEWPLTMPDLLVLVGAISTWTSHRESQEVGPAFMGAATVELGMGWEGGWQAYANPFYIAPTGNHHGLFHHVGAGSLVSSNKRWFRCAQYKHLGNTVQQVRELLEITCLWWTRGCVGYHVNERRTSDQYLTGALLLDKTSEWPLKMPDLLVWLGAISDWNGFNASQEEGPAYTAAATVELGMGWETGWQAYVNPFFGA